MIPYIGDISKKDAEILWEYVHLFESSNILEFGCGASTQVIANYCMKDATFTSIDTDLGWIERTKTNLALLGIGREVHFEEYYQFIQSLSTLKPQYDFIFVDGIDHLRREFAIKMWPFLKVGGFMAFHDTRRAHDFRNLLEVMAHYQDEICTVTINESESNISFIQKEKSQPYENWQITEKREPWQLGYGNPPIDFNPLKQI